MNYLVYLHSIGINHKKLNEIFAFNNDYEWFYKNLSITNLQNFFSLEQTQKILETKSKLNTKNIDEKIEKLQIKIITKYNKEFPKLLLNIKNIPYFLYVRGNLRGNDEFFGIVGSRKISLYAKKVAENIIPDLTNYFTIVSGGAGGCDSLAHKICLENKTKTIAVFGTGIDIIYPTHNYNLFEQIIKSDGAIISIFPIGTPGGIYTFPIRNEIVSGMTKGILIIEASKKSGTLITANFALEQGRDLFAVPGDIFSENYVGTNNLIKNSSAKLITCSGDILEEYNYKKINNNIQIILDNKIQEDIYNLLKYNLSLSIDELIDKSQYDYGQLSLNLTMMELSLTIKKDIFGKYFI